jgi:hypothetical protein
LAWGKYDALKRAAKRSPGCEKAVNKKATSAI